MEKLLNKVTQGDCLEVMREIPDKSVDLVCIDPPYNIGKDKRWDSFQQEEYIVFMISVFKECERVLKEKGSLYWFHNDVPQISKLVESLNKETKLIFKQMITVNKQDNSFVKDLYGSQNKFRNFINTAEYCLFYTLQDDNLKHRIGTGLTELNTKDSYSDTIQMIYTSVKNSKLSKDELVDLFYKEGRYSSYNSAKFHAICKLGLSGGKRFDLMDEKMYNYLAKHINWNFSYQDLKESYLTARDKFEAERARIDEEKWLEYEKTRYTFNASHGVENVWNYSFKEGKKTKHPTQKPIQLIEDIIKYSSNEGDVVLDCFLGSGTTAVAAINTNRQFIGIEREPEYVEIANQRITDAEQTKVGD